MPKNGNITTSNEQEIIHSYYFLNKINAYDIVPLLCGHDICTSEKAVINTAYNHYSMHYILNGKGTYKTAGKTYHLKQGDLFTLFAGENVEYYPDKDDPWEYIYIDFIGTKATYFLFLCGLKKESPIFHTDNKDIEEIFRIIIENNNQASRDFKILSHLYLLFSNIIDERLLIEEPKSKDENIFNKITEYINNNYTNSSLSLKDVAKRYGFNEDYFSRMFKKHYGINFCEYVNELRIFASYEYLKETNLKIKAIASIIGYSNSYYYARKFREITLISPIEYRNNHKNNI